MKRLILYGLAVLVLFFSACNYKRVKGNGHMATDERNINHAERIRLSGSYDVELTQGPVTSLKIEADENILPYIITREEGGELIIKSKDNTSLTTTNPIHINITTNRLEQVYLSGSGNVIGKNKFAGGDKLKIKLTGSGDMDLEVNTPEIDADIAGSGSITLRGETQNEDITISGVGDYVADGLKAENAKVHIAGSGNVKVYAAVSLDIHIAGSGEVSYKGSPSIKQKVAGSGEVKKID